MAHENVHYPPDPLLYKLLVEIGRGVSAIVYKARCVPMNSLVAIKAIDLDQSRADIDSIRREATTMSLLSHTNILRAHCSFTVDRRLWVVMPFMSAGSLQSIISTSFPDGLPESCIAVVLKETLNALQYLHDQGHLHRDIKAGNILLDSDGSVKLADFGVSASIYESNLNYGSSSSSTLLSPSMRLSEITGTPYWMAPEVIHSHTGYSFKADIWSFGITALELAHGRPPLSHLPPSQSLLMKITKRFRFSDYQKSKNEKNFSKAFKAIVKSCLDQDPSRRPTAESLLKHPFFKKCKGSDFLVKTVLQGLPSVEDRFKLRNQPSVSIVKGGEVDEEEEVNDEGSSQGGYTRHRRISGWNFNEEGFELVPVFPTEIDHHPEEAVIKQVRFGGETIIQDMEEMEEEEEEEEETEVGPETSEASPADVTEEEPQVDTHAIEALGGWNFMGAQDGVAANIEVIIPGLESLLQSLYVQRQQVRSLLGRLRGGEEVVQEMTREEQLLHEIDRLGKELENEKQKSFRLEMELQFLKLQMPGGASSGGESGSSSGGAAGH